MTELRLRFTEFSSLNGEQYLLYLGSGGRRLEACHSSFFNGSLAIYMYDGIYQTIGLTNNVFRSVTAQFGGNSDSYFYCYNNLFQDGLCSLTGGNSAWRIYDNVFDHAVVSDAASSAVGGGQNAYVAGVGPLTFDGSPVTLTNLAYARGPLGRYYLSGTNLQNVGSRTAADAGLYHFTTTTNQVRETNSTVDIGFHYMALAAAGQPVDADGDGLADYAEDANGNGAADAGETSFANPDSDYDGRSDGQEMTDGTDPLSASSVVSSRLAYFPFNDTNYAGTDGQGPLAKTNLANVDAWLSKGVQVSSTGTGAAYLKYRDVETNATANINLRNGALRFWFKSSWDTGVGTGNPARLLEVGTKGSTTTNGWWALYFSKTNGTQLTFAAETNNAGATYLTGAVSWAKCDWNQLVLNYTPSNSALYLNSSLVATGLGVTLWPAASVRASGFTVGSDATGTNQAKGIFEDLETFNYPLPTNAIAENFQTNRPPNAIANLKMWLKADAGVVTNNAPSRVSAWLDQTCNFNSATQTSLGSQPLYVTNALNGWPVIHFPGVLDLRPFLTNATEAEAFIVLRASNEIANPFPNGLWKIGTAQGTYPDTAGEIRADFGRDLTTAIGNPTAGITNYHLFSVSSRANEWRASFNGVLKADLITNTVAFTSLPELGRGGNGFAGDIAEVLIYSRVLTSSEREIISTYLSRKYSLVTNTPAAPANLQAAALSPTQVSLWWQGESSASRANYTIERKTAATAFNQIAVVSNTWSFIDASATSNTAYSYRVKVANYAAESAYSSETNATSLASGTNFPLGLKLWLRADAGVPPNRDGSVQYWLDQSGYGNHGFKDSVGPAITNALNSRPVARFSGGQILVFPAATLFTNLTQAEAFMVLKMSTNLTGFDRGLWRFGSAGNLQSYYRKLDGLIEDQFGSTQGFALGTNFSANLTVPHLLNVSSEPNSWKARFNVSDTFTFSTNTVGFSTSLSQPPRLGLGHDNPFNGDIMELLIYPRVLSDDERATVRTYLNSKHNLW